jgi:hypothetical protein
MRTRSKVVIGAGLAFVFAGSVALASMNVRELGRSNPKQAANYRLPWRNFSATYVDGAALGVVVGSTKIEAIQAAERAGLTVEPSGWGDNRAGGASLYDPQTLLASMLRQPYLNFHDKGGGRRGLIVHFRGGRVARIDVHHINTEAI